MVQRKPTTDEYNDRIETVRTLLIRRLPKHSIKKAVREQYGADLNARAIEDYLSRAREQLLADAARGREDFRSESKALYESILADPKAAHRDRIKAQERIDKLMGLEAPQRHLLGNDNENPLPTPILRMVRTADESQPHVERNGTH